MNEWNECVGLPKLPADQRIDVCFSEKIQKAYTATHCLPEHVVSPADVKYWRPSKAAPSATLPAAGSPREVSGMQPDDAEPSRKPSPVSRTQQFGAYTSGDISVKCVSVDKDRSWGVQDTLQERGARYGDFTDNARISQRLKDAMAYEADRWDPLHPVFKEALTMIAQKIARILNGDPDYRDNWHDIQGYAKLAEERCRD